MIKLARPRLNAFALATLLPDQYRLLQVFELVAVTRTSQAPYC